MQASYLRVTSYESRYLIDFGEARRLVSSVVSIICPIRFGELL